MPRIEIIVNVDDGDPSADPDHAMGITNDAYERLTGYTAEWGAGALMWLGEVEEVRKADD